MLRAVIPKTEMIRRISEYRRSLALDEKTLAKIAEFTLEQQLGTLKMIHRFDIALSKRAQRNGATIH